MSRKRTGLRNKYRTGKTAYARKRKSRIADYYGVWVNGRCIQPERIG